MTVDSITESARKKAWVRSTRGSIERAISERLLSQRYVKRKARLVSVTRPLSKHVSTLSTLDRIGMRVSSATCTRSTASSGRRIRNRLALVLHRSATECRHALNLDPQASLSSTATDKCDEHPNVISWPAEEPLPGQTLRRGTYDGSDRPQMPHRRG